MSQETMMTTAMTMMIRKRMKRNLVKDVDDAAKKRLTEKKKWQREIAKRLKETG